MSARELGNPLGNPLGLAREPTVHEVSPLLKDPTIVDFISASGLSGVYTVTPDYKFMRVTVVGAGGAGSSGSQAGSGGGLAQTNVIPVEGRYIDITYRSAARTAAGTFARGASSSASFLSYSLLATGGGTGASAGTGTGGDYNFQGGTAATGGGGGAAGPRDAGGNGAGNGSAAGSSKTGGGGGYFVGFSSAGGGGGVGASGSGSVSAPAQPPGANNLWGGTSNTADGGLWGGGGSSARNSFGGEGGVRIELW